MTNTWTREDVKALIEKSDRAVERGLCAIYARQTEDEQSSDVARHRNGCGFNGRDAGFGSTLARQILAGKPLRGRAVEIARRMCMTYLGQLVEVANASGKPPPRATVAAPATFAYAEEEDSEIYADGPSAMQQYEEACVPADKLAAHETLSLAHEKEERAARAIARRALVECGCGVPYCAALRAPVAS